jgi:hypothetical protein
VQVAGFFPVMGNMFEICCRRALLTDEPGNAMAHSPHYHKGGMIGISQENIKPAGVAGKITLFIGG